MVYLHSTGADAGYWTPLVEHLHQRLDGGIAQLVYDQRNHDHSPTPSHAAQWGLATLIDDLESVLDHASGAIVLTAHSAAAALIHEWARRKPEATRRLAGIVFHSPSLESCCTPEASDALQHSAVRGRSGPFEEFARHLDAAPATPALHARKPGRGLVDNEPQDEFAEPMAAEPPAYSATSLSDEATAVLRVIPTWVLAGQLDPVVAAHRSRNFAEQIWADYDTIPGAGHWLSYTDPRPAAEPILAALEVAYRAAHERCGGGW